MEDLLHVIGQRWGQHIIPGGIGGIRKGYSEEVTFEE